ncbi:ICAM5 protein, partial [Neodrepanis coruscans]|nr:ICAM5 protein [Neodrepanis coruscans]
LECRAEGDPLPSTRCARQGGTRHGATTRPRGGRVVSRADAGSYVCRATNRHGVATRKVVVSVECECGGGEGGG